MDKWLCGAGIPLTYDVPAMIYGCRFTACICWASNGDVGLIGFNLVRARARARVCVCVCIEIETTPSSHQRNGRKDNRLCCMH